MSSRRTFLRTGVGVITSVGMATRFPNVPPPHPPITPDRLRKPEQGMLTLLGNPTEAAGVDRVDQARAWQKTVGNFATEAIHLFFPHIPVTGCWIGESRY